MIHPTCIKLSVILRLAKEYAITRLVIFMKMIYRSDMSKIYADASYNHHSTAYHKERKNKNPGLTSRHFRPTAHGTQATKTAEQTHHEDNLLHPPRRERAHL